MNAKLVKIRQEIDGWKERVIPMEDALQFSELDKIYKSVYLMGEYATQEKNEGMKGTYLRCIKEMDYKATVIRRSLTEKGYHKHDFRSQWDIDASIVLTDVEARDYLITKTLK